MKRLLFACLGPLALAVAFVGGMLSAERASAEKPGCHQHCPCDPCHCAACQTHGGCAQPE